MEMSREEKALNGAMVSLGASGLVAVSGGQAVLGEAAAGAISSGAATFIADGLTTAWGAAPVAAKTAFMGGKAVAGGLASAAEGSLLAVAAPYIVGGLVLGGLFYAGYQLIMDSEEKNQTSYA